MSRVQRIRHFADVLAGLAGVHKAGHQIAGAANQLAGDGCTADRRAGKLAAAGRRAGSGGTVLLAVPLVVAPAIAAASPSGNAPVFRSQPPVAAFGHYPKAFIDWKLSPWPPPRSQ